MWKESRQKLPTSAATIAVFAREFVPRKKPITQTSANDGCECQPDVVRHEDEHQEISNNKLYHVENSLVTVDSRKNHVPVALNKGYGDSWCTNEIK